jgi:hypothetical protein
MPLAPKDDELAKNKGVLFPGNAPPAAGPPSPVTKNPPQNRRTTHDGVLNQNQARVCVHFAYATDRGLIDDQPV